MRNWELTKRRGTLEGAIPGDEPLAAVVLGMLTVSRVVVMHGLDTPVSKLLSELSIPVHIREGLCSTSVRFGYRLDLNAEVVVPDHDC